MDPLRGATPYPQPLTLITQCHSWSHVMSKDKHVLGVMGAAPDNTDTVNSNWIHLFKASIQALQTCYPDVSKLIAINNKK